ncbi:MAG: HAD-IC family P-type ATPase [Candidatus Paceibacterota bacterium]
MEELKLDKKWHALKIDEIFEIFKTDRKGLMDREVEARLKKLGLNEIADNNGDGKLMIFLRQFKNPLIYILIAAGAASFLLKDFFDSIIIFGAVALNTVIGFVQEVKVSNILESLRRFISYKATVVRNGREVNIDAKEVVPGDIVTLRQGYRVPADVRLIKTSNFKTNEMILSGESSPVEKSLAVVGAETPVADRVDMAFMGTFVEEGLAEAVVVATGTQTEFGRIAALIHEKRKEDITPLQAKLGVLARTLGIIFLGISLLLFIIGVASGRGVLEMFLTSVAVAVAAVPESLPVALSITLAIGARRILDRGGLVKKMIAAEALGSTTIIAADKTATLTEGKMRISSLITSDGKELTRNVFPSVIKKDGNDPGFMTLRLLSLVSNATVEDPAEPKEEWKVSGSPIDRAILLTVADAGFTREELEKETPRLNELPFASKYKYSATLNRFDYDSNIITVLGAPEIILKNSESFYEEGDKVKSLTPGKLKIINQKIEDLAAKGFRVLAVGFKTVNKAVESVRRSQIDQLTFLSLVIFSDPIRKEVEEAVAASQFAGLKTLMVTGDHVLTAKYVARELNILRPGGKVIEGKDLPDDLSKVIYDYDVVARVSPEDKVRIVEAFESNGETVAMIGDGINDAPALLRADIGVAPGSGTDVAKEASDLVLLNDSFSIIVEAIKQGRIILDNIKKTIVFLLSGSFTEIILISGSILLGLPLALLPAQILWVNIIEDGLPSAALAFEKGEDDVMRRKPERVKSVFTKEMKLLALIVTLVTDAILFALFYLLYQNGANIDYVRTMLFVGLGIGSLLYIFSIRSLTRPLWEINFFSNRFLIVSILISFALYFVALYIGPMQRLLSVVPLGVSDWLILAAFGVANIVVVEIGKKLLFRRNE